LFKGLKIIGDHIRAFAAFPESERRVAPSNVSGIIRLSPRLIGGVDHPPSDNEILSAEVGAQVGYAQPIDRILLVRQQERAAFQRGINQLGGGERRARIGP